MNNMLNKLLINTNWYSLFSCNINIDDISNAFYSKVPKQISRQLSGPTWNNKQLARVKNNKNKYYKNYITTRLFRLLYWLYRFRQIPCFLGKCFKKKYWIFSQIFFYLKIQSFRLIMENNFIQMAASAGHIVACTIGPIFQHIIDSVQLYFTNSFTNIVL